MHSLFIAETLQRLGAVSLLAHIELCACVLPLQSRQITIIRSRCSSALTPTEMASCL